MIEEKLTVLHISTTLSLGGAENQLVVLIKEQIDLGMNVHVASLKGRPELADEITAIGGIVHNELLGKNPFSQVKRFRSLVRSLPKKTLIHAHLPQAQLVAAMSGVSNKLICSRHDAAKFYPSGPKKLSKLLLGIVNQRTNCWVAISEYVKTEMLTGDEKYENVPVQVVPYGYVPKGRSADIDVTANLKSKYQIHPQDFIFGIVGRLVPEKDHVTLLRAFALVAPDYQYSKLMIVGDGPLNSNLHIISKELEIEDRVIWTGRVSTIAEHLELMDCFILSSKSEGFGLVLLEAMDYDLPIIGSNSSAIPEVLGKTGILFECGSEHSLASKMKFAMSEHNRIDMKINNYAQLEKYNSRLMALRILEVYKNCGDDI